MAQLTANGPLNGSLAALDGAYLGLAYVGVVSTGIFCTMACPSRTPLEKNCRFFETVADCEAAGFRACKRCRPAGQKQIRC